MSEKLKGVLYINGVPPQHFPGKETYAVVACTDGALTYLEQGDFPTDELDFISGDMDSYGQDVKKRYPEKFIETPDQDYTDFYKALELMLAKFPSLKEITVLGCSGGEMDHFLGNITVAYAFRERVSIRFEDAYSFYYFIPKRFSLDGVLGKTISLYPYPTATGITTQGLHWEVENYEMDIRGRIGTRNRADADEIHIEYTAGDVLLFVSKE